jgi:hypothetical protein
MTNDEIEKSPLQQQLWDSGNLVAIDIPQTHFPVQNSEWVLISDGLNLPKIGQEILFVVDVRGSQDESLLKLYHNNRPQRCIVHGYVLDVGFDKPSNQWWVSAGDDYIKSFSNKYNTDHIVYWAPLPALPGDNFVRSPFDFHQTWQISMAKLKAEENL